MEGEAQQVKESTPEKAIAVLEEWTGRVRRGERVQEVARQVKGVVLPALGGCREVSEAAAKLVDHLSDRGEGQELVLSGTVAEELAVGCRSPLLHVRSACARAVKRAITATSTPQHVDRVLDSGTVPCVLQLLDDEDTGVAARAVGCLQFLLENSHARTRLATQGFIDSLKQKVAGKGVVAMRVLDGMSEAASCSEEVFRLLKAAGVLDAIADGVEESTADLLLLLNYLEVLEVVCRSPLGVEFCGTRPGLAGRIVKLAEQGMVEAVSGLALRFIGNFGAHSEQNAAAAVDNRWFDTALRHADTERGIEAVAALCSTRCGLQHLCDRSAGHVFLVGALSANPAASETALHALAVVFEAAGAGSEAHRAAASLFFRGVLLEAERDVVPLKVLLAHRSHSITAVRLAALRFISALCSHPFAVSLLTSDQVLWDWFTDPDVELDMMCKETKFGAIQKLSANMSFIERSDDEVTQLSDLIKCGPFYTKRRGVTPEANIDD